MRGLRHRCPPTLGSWLPGEYAATGRRLEVHESLRMPRRQAVLFGSRYSWDGWYRNLGRETHEFCLRPGTLLNFAHTVPLNTSTMSGP